MRMLLVLITCIGMVGCGDGFHVANTPNGPEIPNDPIPDPVTYYPIATYTINVKSYADLMAKLKKKPNTSIASLFLPMAHADVAQGSATVSVTYNNPGVSTFTVNTSALGVGMTVVGNDLNMGNITVSGLDDNSLKVCVGAPGGGKCNRLYIRVFTLGTATGGITGTAGFINKTDVANPYGIDVFAGSVLTPIGFNASALAATVTDAAQIYQYTIPGNMNRVRLSNLSVPSIPIKADLSNAGSGDYEMNLVVQYALGYQ